MTFDEKINNEYFEWMCSLVCNKRYSKEISYQKLLTYLHEVEFIYMNPRDINRAEDGIDLRYRFSLLNNYDDLSAYLKGPCSVLEMILALSIRCEESIMDDPLIGDRTSQWFWGMISNLGLGTMNDNNFDRRLVDHVIMRFLNREYDADGRGGLFTIKNCNRDLRDVEIWYQLNWYLDNIV